MKDAPIYKKVLDKNLVKRAIEIERINIVIVDENKKLLAEVTHLHEQLFQLNEELEQNTITDADYLEHFVATESTPLTNNNDKKCCCIL